MRKGSGTDEGAGRIKRSLRAGLIPEEYKGIIESAEVREKRVFIKDKTKDAAINPYASEEEMKERVGTAKTGISAIRGSMNGKRSTLIKILLKSPVKIGWKRKVRK